MLSISLKRLWFTFSKIVSTPQQAIQGIKDGSLLMVGGFGISSIPMNLINALYEQKTKDLTIISNNCGYDDGKMNWGLAYLLKNKQIRRMISSYVGENAQFKRQYFNGQLQLQICPQGTLAQKIRSGGAGIPAFYTPTGVDTIIQQGGFPIKYGKDVNGQSFALITAEPKPSMVFNGRKFIMEKSLFADFAFIKAKRADKMGNLQFSDAGRNFNADMATAAKVVVAQVQQIVENGQIPANQVHVPSAYVNRIYQNDKNSPFSQKYIEKLAVSESAQIAKMIKQSQLGQLNLFTGGSSSTKDQAKTLKIARRAAKQVKSGMSVNLGIGIPTLLPSVLPQEVKITIQSENGILGVGGPPSLKQAKSDLIDAGKSTVTIIQGGSFFSSSQSFGMIRGGHLDMTMLGALEVSRTCDIANWIIPGKMMNGMGGAMDLVASGSKVIVLMQHAASIRDKPGQFEIKLLQRCNHPLTAKGVVSMVITQLAVFENKGGRLVLTQIAEQSSLQQVQKKTGFPLQISQNITRF